MKIERFMLLTLLSLLFLFSNLTFATNTIKCNVATFASISTPKDSLSLKIDSASIVPLSGSTQSYCDVKGHILTSKPVTPDDQGIKFEVKMPIHWNNKLLMFGNGGLGGSIESADTGNDSDFGGKFSDNWGLDRGYTIVATDTGHVGISRDFTNFRNPNGSQNIDRIINWGNRSTHLVAITTQKIVNAYYRTNPRHSYFMGFSNGGRQALMEAQRYPGDFDGIISGAPSGALVETIIRFIVNELAQYPVNVESPVLTAANIALLGSTTLKICGAADGIQDWLITNPESCHFKPSKDLPKCSNNVANANCFTAHQIEVIDTLYSEIRIPGHGEIPRLLPGYENNYWPLWIVGKGNPNLITTGMPSVEYLYALNHLKYFVYNDLSYDMHDFILSVHAKDMFLTPSGVNLYQITEANNPDLSSFKEKNGKLILINGLADPIIPVTQTIKYYENVKQVMGVDDNKLQKFIRFFIVPGMDHTSPSPSLPTKIDPLTALENWVEKGVAPDSILSYRTNVTGAIDWSRPVCSYPKRAILNAGKNPKDPIVTHDAANFHCANTPH